MGKLKGPRYLKIENDSELLLLSDILTGEKFKLSFLCQGENDGQNEQRENEIKIINKLLNRIKKEIR